MAECSESIGRSQASGVASGSPGSAAARAAAWARASAITRWPPATSVSLLAVATTLPARSAASVGRSDTTPPVPTITRSTSSRVASSTRASSPRTRVTPGGRSRSVGLVREGDDRRAQAPGLRLELARRCDRRPGRRPRTGRRGPRGPRRSAGRCSRWSRAARRGRARRQRTSATTYSATTGPANRNESIRSRIPPWPGIRVPESFAPAARLSIDSARSPAWAARPSSGPRTRPPTGFWPSRREHQHGHDRASRPCPR